MKIPKPELSKESVLHTAVPVLLSIGYALLGKPVYLRFINALSFFSILMVLLPLSQHLFMPENRPFGMRQNLGPSAKPYQPSPLEHLPSADGYLWPGLLLLLISIILAFLY